MAKSHITIYRHGSSSSGLTDIFHVETAETKIYLGAIKCSGAWRCYAFYPDQSTVFEKTCLREIADFCDKRTQVALDLQKRRNNDHRPRSSR